VNDPWLVATAVKAGGRLATLDTQPEVRGSGLDHLQVTTTKDSQK